MTQHINVGLFYTVKLLVLFEWNFFSTSVGTQGAQNEAHLCEFTPKTIHHLISFFFLYESFLFFNSFMLIVFNCCSLICFVYMRSSLCAHSVWPLCWLCGGFSSPVCVGGGGWLWYSCMSLWAAFPPLMCVSVCFAWLNCIEVHLQILNVASAGHLSHCQVQ